MPFRPTLTTQITIDRIAYSFPEHPFAKGMPYGQTGRRATVYQVRDVYGRLHALKVFTHVFRTAQIAHGAAALQPFAGLPGLQVCARLVLTRSKHSELIQQYPDLEYAVLMPWAHGQTWQEIMVSRQTISPPESLMLARSLSATLATMEQNNLAHCDLSGANLLIPSHGGGLALVDVEEMYAPGFERPRVLPAGSAGYAHRAVKSGIWSVEADRFAGAVILVEMLGWCDARIQSVADAEQYFSEQEMQSDCPKFEQLAQFIQTTWGNEPATLFRRAWFSESLSNCPTSSNWAEVLQNVSQRAQVTAPQPFPSVNPMPSTARDVSLPRPTPVGESFSHERPRPVASGIPAWGWMLLVFVLLCLGGFVLLGGGAWLVGENARASSGNPGYVAPVNEAPIRAEPTAISRPVQRATATDVPVVGQPAQATTAPTRTQRPTPTETPQSCPGAPAQRLKVDGKAYVCTKRDSVILREGPGRSYSEIRRLVPGADLKIIGGPSCANSWSWWEVKTESGFTGWMAEGGDATDTYFLCPND